MATHSQPPKLSPLTEFTSNEVEFLAEDELITVTPRFRMAKLDLVRGEFGPFRPQVPVQVPLWMAISLKKQRQCTVQPPEWLTVDALKELKKAEQASSIAELQDVPTHYMEITSLLFQHAPEDINKIEQVRSLLEDIENIRQHKIRQGLRMVGEQQLDDVLHFIKLNNASAMELHGIRRILLGTLGEFYKLHAARISSGSGSNSTAMTPSSGSFASSSVSGTPFSQSTVGSQEQGQVSLRRFRKS